MVFFGDPASSVFGIEARPDFSVVFGRGYRLQLPQGLLANSEFLSTHATG
jgi:hypothetical protein